jgi:thiol peroxidase
MGVTFKGTPLTITGVLPQVGAAAPDFHVLDTALAPVSLATFAGQTLVLLSVPSLDTPVCDVEARNFNSRMSTMGPDVVLALVSMDLPFAQVRWCGTAGANRIRLLSDHREAGFGSAYGVLIREWRLLARAVFVVDHGGMMRYVELVPEITQEPRYTTVLDTVARLRG